MQMLRVSMWNSSQQQKMSHKSRKLKAEIEHQEESGEKAREATAVEVCHDQAPGIHIQCETRPELEDVSSVSVVKISSYVCHVVIFHSLKQHFRHYL